jgi:hypothetical protein
MKKFAVIFVLAISLSSLAFAGDNSLAFVRVDSDFATSGFQGGPVFMEIDPNQFVGFEIFGKNFDDVKGMKIDITWSGDTQAITSGEAGFGQQTCDYKVQAIPDGFNTINEVPTGLAAETGIFTAAPLIITVADVAGQYRVDIASQDATPAASSDYAMLYCAIFKTPATFSTSTGLVFTVKVTLVNEANVEKNLFPVYFYINTLYTDVKTKSWGEIKNQFKDF